MGLSIEVSILGLIVNALKNKYISILLSFQRLYKTCYLRRLAAFAMRTKALSPYLLSEGGNFTWQTRYLRRLVNIGVLETSTLNKHKREKRLWMLLVPRHKHLRSR